MATSVDHRLSLQIFHVVLLLFCISIAIDKCLRNNVRTSTIENPFRSRVDEAVCHRRLIIIIINMTTESGRNNTVYEYNNFIRDATHFFPPSAMAYIYTT